MHHGGRCAYGHIPSQRLAFSAGALHDGQGCRCLRRPPRNYIKVVAFAKSSKRLKYSHTRDKQTRGEPLFVKVESDGSDLWRLDTVINMLKTGAVCRLNRASLIRCSHITYQERRIVQSIYLVTPSFLQVGIVPTDSYPAIVCDIDNKQAVERLYTVKGLDPKKQLSILCRHLQDISTYTLGFPASNQPGQADIFRTARQVLPGPVSPVMPTRELATC